MTTSTLSRPNLRFDEVVPYILAAVFALILYTLAQSVVSGEIMKLRYLPFPIVLHVATVVPVVPLTIYMLVARKGSRIHKLAGYVWSVLMLTTATAALFIDGPLVLSFIKLFSILTITGVPRAIIAARKGDIAAHRRVMNSMILGGLVIAGLTAFIPGRLMFDFVTG